MPPWPFTFDTSNEETIKAAYGDTYTAEFFMAGSTNISGNSDFYLIKAMGPGIVWQQTYGTAMNEYANTMCYYPGMGGLYVLGGTAFNGTNYDAMALNANLAGALFGSSWIFDYAGGKDEINDLTNRSSFIAASGYVTTAGGDKNFLVSVLQESSSAFYSYNDFVFGGAGDDVLNAGAEATSAFFVTGYTTTASAGGKDVYFANVDPMNSIVLFDTTYGGALDDEMHDIWYNPSSSSLVCAGYTESTGAGGKDLLVMNVDMSGAIIWQKIIGGAGDEEGFAISGIGDFSMGYGFYTITGYTTSYGSDTNMYVVKLDMAGNILYEGFYDQPLTQIAYDFVPKDNFCQIPVVGKTTGVGLSDAVLAIASPRIEIITTSLDVSCFGFNDGTATTQIVGSTYKTQYNWNNSTGSVIATNQPTVSGLIAGLYFVTINDMSLSCPFSDTVIILEPDELTSVVTTHDVTCTGSSNGIGIITPDGGVPPYTYGWDDGGTDSINYSLTESVMYNVSVTDVNGCTTSQEMMVGKQALATLSGLVLPTTGGYVADGLLQAEILKINGLGDAESLVTVPIYSMGYDFIDLEPANYLLRILIDPSMVPELLPTYYGNQYNWELATIIEAGCDSAFTSINVQLLESSVTFDGLGTFSGTVVMVIDPAAKDVGEPVPGAEIYLEQEPEGEPIAVTETDGDGNYEIDSIPDGSFSLSVDIPGFPLIQTYSDINVSGADTSYTTLNFYVDTTSGETGIYIEDPYISVPTVDGNFFSVKTYPNPFNEIINVDYILEKNSDVKIEIVDNQGKVVIIKVNQNEAKGAHQVAINNITEPGIYYLKLQVNQSVYLKKIIKQ
ncbi:MAG: hypothetical protein A2W91_09265 [Bacteroidetes bacterium GWF2_38_335]|nr:MAG: hypothetical protein A2W91_09265 [Bacteroidetes bacterium GWF2_38_335]OFY80841.1 MAG: hypothetical protein A2281_09235 [Bacteroidetes bacterium RIFOXYA12_FULL_38_20]